MSDLTYEIGKYENEKDKLSLYLYQCHNLGDFNSKVSEVYGVLEVMLCLSYGFILFFCGLKLFLLNKTEYQLEQNGISTWTKERKQRRNKLKTAVEKMKSQVVI